MITLAPGRLIRHPKLGGGHIVAVVDQTSVVRFESGELMHCANSDLTVILSPGERLESCNWDLPLPALLRAQAAAIRSVNDQWGVFARSRVVLLPHQLWVCKRVLQRWPSRWLVADDVGLGKTIEAGLMLTSLLSSGRVRRLLVLAPASLVEQWQVRLREMFDIRLTRYSPDADTPRADFWNSQTQVVASAQTLRLDTAGRWDRLLEADPWDLVIVDEAHHLNADEEGGPTLAYKLASELEEKARIISLIFFTGTPHRGKNFGFFSLLRLLRRDLFDPRLPIKTQLPHLREVMIRNNKQRVTTMAGDPLFTKVTVSRVTFSYSTSEAEFYVKLTEFISSGKAFAGTLDSSSQRTVILVLITMQKLASSSIAAIRHALAGRLRRLKAAEHERDNRATQRKEMWAEFNELQSRGDPSDDDRLAYLAEKITEIANPFALNPREIPALEELIRFADAVRNETKIALVLEVIRERFADRSVLLFTEYKATQALVVSELRRLYGEGGVTFINGDEYLEGVQQQDGTTRRIDMRRGDAKEAFNSGRVRFLVSTEAAGEGVDLHHACSSLIHVDLPWNPMRLHQRVGRLSRYGQGLPVDVVALHNPSTVEGRIWELLNEKLARITEAFQSAMDDPEDMLNVVLGMASQATYDRLFSDAQAQEGRLEAWFNAETATFGGQDAIELVRQMFGNVARFDFGEAGKDLPRVDLPDLRPFMKSAASNWGRRVETADLTLSFLTPELWRQKEVLLPDRCELHFNRDAVDQDLKKLAGIGHRAVDVALAAASELEEGTALLSDRSDPLVLFRVRDKLTDSATEMLGSIVLGAEGWAGDFRLLRDWEVITRLNQFLDRPQSIQRSSTVEFRPKRPDQCNTHLGSASAWIASQLKALDIDFRFPDFSVVAVLWPSESEIETPVA